MQNDTSLNSRGYFQADSIGASTRSFYHEQGYIVIEEAFSKSEIALLQAEAVAICRGECGPIRFSKNSSVAKENLVGLSDDDLIRKFLCIHHPHKISDHILKTLSQPVLVKLLENVIGPNVKCMQSMLFVKSAGKPGQAWHQDEDYIPTRDRSLCGAWIAMDDATVENGCLWVIPGSHKPGVLYPQYPHKDDRFDCALESYDFPHTDEDAIPVEVKAGSVVFFNGYLLHRSLPNKTQSGFRRALVNHYMSAESFLPWGKIEEGVVIAKADSRDIVLVAGSDPHAWKGTQLGENAYVRADGQGGCGNGRTDLDDWKSGNTIQFRASK